MSKFGFNKQLEKLQESKSTLPVKLGNQAQRFFLSSFKNEGWDDGGLNRWTNRKDEKNTRNLLVKTGSLRRAVADSIRESSWNKIRLEVDVTRTSGSGSYNYAKAHNEYNYAKAHNEGTKHIPQRKFIGDSHTLRKMQMELLEKEFNKIFKDGR